MGVRRGLTPARGIIHLHSPYSHDACDGMPRDLTMIPGGPINEPCLADLRAALCTTHVDYAALTDHDGSMADEEFTKLFSMRGGDQPIVNTANEQIASKMTCDDGHEVDFTIGGENDIMPIMLDRHVVGSVAERHATYNGDDAAAAAAFRAAGGLVWMAHTEQHDLPELHTIAPDGVELYNLHANIDPKIRPMYLGLDASGAIAAVADFADTNPGHPEPDLAFIAFFSPSGPALDRWNALLGEGKHVAASAGTDAHENALPIMLGDGERGDSYRRMIRWFGNIALVDNPHDPAHVKAALASGRMFVAFEVFGTPDGFDARAVTATTTTELGGTVAVADAATFTVDLPHVLGLDPSLPAPEITAKLIRVDATGAHDLATAGDGTLTTPMTAVGAYRVEIWITPHHLGPYLGDLGTKDAEVSLPWIYSNPIYVE